MTINARDGIHYLTCCLKLNGFECSDNLMTVSYRTKLMIIALYYSSRAKRMEILYSMYTVRCTRHLLSCFSGQHGSISHVD